MSSCEEVPEGGKTNALHYDGKTYPLTYGTMQVVQLGPDSYDYAVELWDASKLLSGYKGEVHMLYFRLNGTEDGVRSGTYQLKEPSQGVPSSTLVLATAADPKNVRIFEFKSGEIIVDRKLNYYKFTIKLVDAAGKIGDGFYAGILVEKDDDGGWDD